MKSFTECFAFNDAELPALQWTVSAIAEHGVPSADCRKCLHIRPDIAAADAVFDGDECLIDFSRNLQ
jgi:hypothetical protein